MRNIGKNIRILRTDANMTQDDLADALFVTRQTVSNYETGKSKPDIDTLLNIAQILNTDINAILYGPQLSNDRKKARKWTIFGGIFCAATLALYLVLFGVCKELQHLYYSSFLHLLKLTLRPLVIFAFGWYLLHIVRVICRIKSDTSKVTRTVRICLYCLLGLMVMIPLPYDIWLLVGGIRSFVSGSISMSFPYIPVYTEILMAIVYSHLKFPFFMAIIGALCRLFDIPNTEKR